MFKIKIAELNIEIENKYKYVEKMCIKYLTDEDKTDFTVSVTDEEILKEAENEEFDKGYLESLAVYRKIAEKILEYNGFLMHAAVIDIYGTGIAFLAKSGVGKTTHISLWKEVYGKKIKIINGDKPLIRIINGGVYAYGTPWAGKENLNSNRKTKLRKICFLNRAEKNKCFFVDKRTVLADLLNQIYKPKKTMELLKTLKLADMVVKGCEFYVVECNCEKDAAKTAYNAML